MVKQKLSSGSRKALSVHLDDSAGSEVGKLIQQLLDRVEQLECTKIDVTPIATLAPVSTQVNANGPTT